ncbi:putative transcription factor C2H2 family [Helianthus annuus]|nr:putative transcription factor C2H2 family [Helianthus annuus]KAJ0658100.1 putative transcription factor C2H2 family [Helianthus annuus]KAJ0661766.1 putative transcription factor C2H2 family [Helianthus annuus]
MRLVPHRLYGQLMWGLYTKWALSPTRLVFWVEFSRLLSCSDGEKCLSFRFPHNSEAVVLQQVRVIVTAEELGAKDISPLDVHSYNNTSTDKLPEDQRPRTREVMFFYIYDNDRLHKTQVTEDYTCPFCLLKCASYTGLACHLPASHDLFNYEFRVG